MLLYNLTRNVRDRVARASGVLLASVSWAYLTDVFVGLEPRPETLETWFRLQWIGVSILPAAMFHLSDALLATTGLVSRGRRKRAVRAFYVVGTLFSLSAMFTEALVATLMENPVPHMSAGSLFIVFIFYYIVAVGFALNNVIRAWQRCLTTYTQRRMGYLMGSFWTPAWGIFPYSLLFSVLPQGMNTVSDTLLWLTFNIANLAVLGMLAFMSYPLSFFGEQRPDRVVRLTLLQFMLRGPLTGVVIVVVLQSFPTVERSLDLNAQAFVTFAAVGAVLCVQWGITLIMPFLESSLIYTEDQQQARVFQEFSQRILTRSDAAQLLEAILAALCDQLRVPTAFVASVFHSTGASLEQFIGLSPEDVELTETQLSNDLTQELIRFQLDDNQQTVFVWKKFWLIPIHYAFDEESGQFLGVLGFWARSESPDLDQDDQEVLQVLGTRVADVLTDMRLQTQIFDTIEGLLPVGTQERANLGNISVFGQISMQSSENVSPPSTLTRQSIVSSPEFPDMVRDALRNYWGGAKLHDSALLQLNLVDQTAAENDGNRINALRQVLDKAIKQLRPEGQQNFTRTDWMLYNILEMRFLQGRKVRETARRLTMSQSDFYRKQRLAIEAVARIILEQETSSLDGSKPSSQPPNA